MPLQGPNPSSLSNMMSFFGASGISPTATRFDLAHMAVPANSPLANPATWGQRPDGSQKGMGWLGLLQRPDGGISSEISVGINIDGKETEIPLLVPTLTQSEVRTLLSIPIDENFHKNLPKSILNKAIAHAQSRIEQGQSPFASIMDFSEQGY